MGIEKSGISKNDLFNESESMNLVQENQRNLSYGYTPTTAYNSCLAGYIVDFSTCKAGDIIHLSLDLEFSGLDSSNTNGTFKIIFQGPSYEVASSSFVWKGDSGIRGSNIDITSIVNGKNGNHHFDYYFTLSSDYPNTYSKHYLSFRSDYSNGTGKITMKNLKVINSKYYNTKIGKDYISSQNFYEL